MSTDPAVQAAIDAARAMQRRWHSDDTEAVCRAAVEAARPIIEAEALEPVYGDPPESLMHSVDAELRAERDRAVEERDAAIAERDRARHYALRLTRARAAERPEPGTLSDEGYADVRAVNEAAAARRAAVRTEPGQCGRMSGWTGDDEEPVPPRYRCTLPVGHDGVHNAEPVSEPEQ